VSYEVFDKHIRPSLPAVRCGSLRIYPVALLERWLAEHAVAPADELAEEAASSSDGVARRAEPNALVDAARLAAILGVRREFVYRHAAELGGLRLGEGQKARLRFDVSVATERIACLASNQSLGDSPSDDRKVSAPSRPRARRLPNRVPQPGSILAVRPRGGDARAA
jgi:hypothetical protein